MTVDVVTGAFSFTGRAIAERLLARGRLVRTPSRRPAEDGDPLGARVEWAPLQFADRSALRDGMRGAGVLYTTYWVRFERARLDLRASRRKHPRAGRRGAQGGRPARGSRQCREPVGELAVRILRRQGARGTPRCGVRPLVRDRPSDARLQAERHSSKQHRLDTSTLSAVRRRRPYQAQPVSVAELAASCVDAGTGDSPQTFDVAEPEVYSYDDLVRAIAAAMERRALVVHLHGPVVTALAGMVGLLTRDVLANAEELGALRAELLLSRKPPRSQGSVAEWLGEAGPTLGHSHASELARNFRSYGPI